MKLAYTVATPDTADAGMLALRGPLEESFALLARLGYHAAELMIRDPARLSATAIRRQAGDLGLALPAVSTGQLRKEDGLQLCHADASARQRAIDRTRAVIDFAAALGAQVNFGTLRGQLDADREAGIARAAGSFAVLAEHAAAAGVVLAVEPQCRYVSNWLNTVAETLAFLEPFPAERARVLFDVYHALLEEDSIAAAMIRARPRLSYVQFSDSNRRAPGEGQIHFGDLLRALHALGYQGYVSIECLQTPSSEAAARKAIARLRPLLEEFE